MTDTTSRERAAKEAQVLTAAWNQLLEEYAVYCEPIKRTGTLWLGIRVTAGRARGFTLRLEKEGQAR